MSADDFLPMFTFVLVQASLPQLLLVKEIMTALVDDEETFGECGKSRVVDGGGFIKCVSCFVMYM